MASVALIERSEGEQMIEAEAFTRKSEGPLRIFRPSYSAFGTPTSTLSDLNERREGQDGDVVEVLQVDGLPDPD
jgi:hypothetical protein